MTLTVQRSFAGGEISPALYGRSDLVKYSTGLSKCSNFMIDKRGGAVNRPGTQYICEVKDSSKKVRLAKFVYNDQQTYILEFGDRYIRFIQNGILIKSAGLPYEVATPYTSSEIHDIQYAQSNDVITLVHKNHPIHQLKRYGLTNWVLSQLTTAPPISEPHNLTINNAGNVCPYVVTAVQSGTLIESYASGAVAAATIPNTTNNASNTISWSAVAGAQAYNVYRGEYGAYGYLFQTTNLNFTDDGTYPRDLTKSPPQINQPFNASDKYPGTVGYYQQRQIFGSTNDNSQGIWMSRTGDFNNFSYHIPLQGDDPITLTVAGKQVNEIRHIVNAGKLLLLTAANQWSVEFGASGASASGNISLNQLGHNGADKIPVLVSDNIILYVQARGNTINAMQYQLTSDGYTTEDLTIFANHLFDGYQVNLSWDFQKIPHSVVWVIRDDGELLGLTYIPSQQVYGWHHHSTIKGAYEQVCVVPEGGEDVLYVVVKRQVNGSEVRYIERMASRLIVDVAKDSKFLDSYNSYDGTNYDDSHTLKITGGTDWDNTENLILTSSKSYFTTTMNDDIFVLTDSDGATVRCKFHAYTSDTSIEVRPLKTVPTTLRNQPVTTWSRAVISVSGLDYLEGEDVLGLGDGNVNDTMTVTNGSVTLANHYSVIHVGLPITSQLKTLPISNPQGQPLLDNHKLVDRVSLQVVSSRGVWVGIDEDHLAEYKQKSPASYGQAPGLLTGVIDINITSSWNKNGQVLVSQKDPLPLSVLAVAPAGLIGGV